LKIVEKKRRGRPGERTGEFKIREKTWGVYQEILVVAEGGKGRETCDDKRDDEALTVKTTSGKRHSLKEDEKSISKNSIIKGSRGKKKRRNKGNMTWKKINQVRCTSAKGDGKR